MRDKVMASAGVQGKTWNLELGIVLCYDSRTGKAWHGLAASYLHLASYQKVDI